MISSAWTGIIIAHRDIQSYPYRVSPGIREHFVTEEHDMDRKQSGLGIASFIISITTGVLIFMLFMVAGAMAAATHGNLDNNSVGLILLGLFIIFFILLDLVAVGLGIAGLFQNNRKKVFAILGLVFSVMILLFTGFMMILGSIAG